MVIDLNTYNTGKPLCGNIYRDKWQFEGRRFTSYYVDCAGCGLEVALFGVCRKRSAARVARDNGWTQHPEHGKWVCPNCTKAEGRGK